MCCTHDTPQAVLLLLDLWGLPARAGVPHRRPDRAAAVTQHPVKVLEDGTRVYSNYTRYAPVPEEARKYKRRKPPQEGAVRLGGTWFLPLALQPLVTRSWPETRPDTDAYLHASKPRKCRCLVCQRPEARVWRLRGLRHAEPPPGL